MRKLINILLALAIILLPSPVMAVSVMLYDHPVSISTDEFTVTASVSGAKEGTNYLRIDLYNDGTANYFGETFNGNSWYSGSVAAEYLPIEIQSGTPWSGSIKGKVGTPLLSEYDGTGNYKLRIRRYTSSSGNYNPTEANDSAVVVAIVFPTQTPVPSSTPEPSDTPSPTKTPTPAKNIAPTATTIPSNKPAPTVVKKTPTIKKLSPRVTKAKVVLGKTDKRPSLTPEPTDSMQVKGAAGFNPGIIFISLGGVFLLACGILGIYMKKKDCSS